MYNLIGKIYREEKRNSIQTRIEEEDEEELNL